ncbi:MAG: hypothetical protein N2D54_01910, partial [Chloroflexota bacterium]
KRLEMKLEKNCMVKDNSIDKAVTEKLIRFTDQVIGGEEPTYAGDDESMVSLQKVIVGLHKASNDLTPSQEFSTRVKRNLNQAWSKKDSNQKKSWLERLFPPQGSRPSKRRRQIGILLPVVVTTLAIILLVFPLMSGGSSGLEGAANGDAGLAPIIVGLGMIALIGYLIWDNRK